MTVNPNTKTSREIFYDELNRISTLPFSDRDLRVGPPMNPKDINVNIAVKRLYHGGIINTVSYFEPLPDNSNISGLPEYRGYSRGDLGELFSEYELTALNSVDPDERISEVWEQLKKSALGKYLSSDMMLKESTEEPGTFTISVLSDNYLFIGEGSFKEAVEKKSTLDEVFGGDHLMAFKL